MNTLADLERINMQVNALPYESEVGDDWTPIVTSGDCDSYATAKLERLVRNGWPVESLRLATCFVEPAAAQEKRDRYHAVLLVDFEDTTYVLDNRQPYPTRHDFLPYEWHKFWNHDLNAWEYAEHADRRFT